MKHLTCRILLTTCIATLGCIPLRAAESQEAQAPNHARVCEPAVKPAFLPLPIGAIEPQAWLRDWAVSAREGITGHLDEWHPVFADGWKGRQINAPNAKPDGTGWPLEQSAYWLDGALRLGLVLHDEALIKKIRARLDPVVDGVNRADADSSFIYWINNFKPQGFDSWAHSQMGRALVALYQGTGEKRVLDALVKVYAAYEGDLHLPPGSADVSGLCNLDAMLETYSFSGDRRILDRALKAITEPAVAQEFKAWETGQVVPGHMVILYEDIRLPAIVYPWTGDEHLLQATLGAGKWLDEQHMLPYGVPSGEEYASGIGAFRKTETCDVTAMLLTSSWLYRICGDGDWGDRMERAFFNAAAAPIARDFQTLSYYQSPNRLRSDSLPAPQPNCPGANGILFHKLGCPQVLCCVGAVNRIIPNYIIHMWMATRDNGLAATLYGPSTVSALVGDGVPVKVSATTDYPFGETIRMTVEPSRNAAFPLYLRIPGWCRNARVAVNGSEVPVTRDNKGFVRIARTWTKNDRVELKLPMNPQVIRGYETDVPPANRNYFGYRGQEYFQPVRRPYASVLLGPLLFALPVADVDPNTPAADAKWQYALATDATAHDAGITVERRPMPAHWDWPLNAPVRLQAPVQSFDWQPTDYQSLPAKPVAGNASVTVQLVPYGCTKFRISMFPVTERVWKNPPPDGLSNTKGITP
ncbi:MAG: beta-L-arabinofuranosidase domain-containing protein [bacterium]